MSVNQVVSTRCEPPLLTRVRGALDGADESLLCVAFVSMAGVHLLRRQFEQPTPTRLLATTVPKPSQVGPDQVAIPTWDYLTFHGRLSNRYLVANDGLNVKRSSAVCALLAQLPGVQVVSTNPIELAWTGDLTMSQPAAVLAR